MAEVSVVVPSLQQGRYLERCLASIRAQADIDVELLVVDGGSTDETLDVVERWRSAIDVAILEPDHGQADAIAKGIARSSSPLVTWLNADDAYAGPDALRTLATWLERRPDVDLVYGRRAWIDDDGALLRVDRWRPFDAAALRQACYLPQECALFRRAAYERAGGIDPSFSFALDYDLWLRMLGAESRFLSVPALVGLFRVHAEQKSTARWRSVGLPEIEQLQRRELGWPVAERLMGAVAETHRAGGSHREPAAARRLRHDVAALFDGHLVALLDGRPLDRWASIAG